MLRELEKRVLMAFSKNPRDKDSEVARRLGTSQPTVTRIRAYLEKKGLLRYANHPKLDEIECELLVFTVFRVEGYKDPKLVRKAQKWIRNHPTVLFSAPGEGLNGKTELIISIHKNFAEYEEFARELRRDWENSFREIDQFITSVNKTIKEFDYTSIIKKHC